MISVMGSSLASPCCVRVTRVLVVVIGIQIAAIYLGAFDVDKLANFSTRPKKPVKHQKSHLEPISEQKSAYWFDPPPFNRGKWGTKKPDEKFDWGDDFTEPTEERVKRAPNVIGAGAKKCGTIAFSTFLALNKQFRTTRFVEGHYLYKPKLFASGLEAYKDKLPLSYPSEVSYEGTPRYLVESSVPGHAKAINETMKIVIVLCDPIKRFKSDFVHTTKTHEPHAQLIKSYKGIEDYIVEYLPKVKSKIAKNPTWLTDIYYHSITSSVFTNGIYSYFILHWLKYFPLEQFLFLDGEKILKEPYTCMEQAQEFMNMPKVLGKDDFYINDETGFYCAFIPGSDKNQTKCLPKYKGRTRNTEDDDYLHISNATLALLEDFYRPFNAQLCEILPEKFSFFKDLC